MPIMSNWTLFSNHGHVLVCLARDPGARLRDVATAVGITERAVQKIVRDLQDGGMVSVTK
ncbi:MAG: winged helix-turn-helix domain-containing protein, partial [Xanthomonadales bacterium]|nr:winged helix-turn-helix domain-containing protein [Xanthomonadales bacterium]